MTQAQCFLYSNILVGSFLPQIEQESYNNSRWTWHHPQGELIGSQVETGDQVEIGNLELVEDQVNMASALLPCWIWDLLITEQQPGLSSTLYHHRLGVSHHTTAHTSAHPRKPRHPHGADTFLPTLTYWEESCHTRQLSPGSLFSSIGGVFLTLLRGTWHCGLGKHSTPPYAALQGLVWASVTLDKPRGFSKSMKIKLSLDP